MDKKENFMIDNAILYRAAIKYYDNRLKKYDIGYGQVVNLMMIHENPGITMKQLSANGSVDKGTITKSVSKLQEAGYIRIEENSHDKRSKKLKTTTKAKDVIADMYLARKDWWTHLTSDLTLEETDQLEKTMHSLVKKAIEEPEYKQHFRIFGFQKLTLLDYPGKMACTLFAGGCNFKCPFCHNSDLVFLPENMVEIDQEDILNFLEKRKNILEGVCVTGGEPLLQNGLRDFLRKIKDMGYLVKLDTNGSFPDQLKDLVEEGLVDYVAVDIKNAPKKYNKTIGLEGYRLDSIKSTVQYLLEDHVDYEFRTTIIKEFHTENDMKLIGEWIKGAKRYYLQNFEDNENVIKEGLHACSLETLMHYKEILKEYVNECELRGVEERI